MFPFLSILGMLAGCGEASNPNSTLECPTMTEKEGRHELTSQELLELRTNCSAYDLIGLNETMGESWYSDEGDELETSARCERTLLTLANLTGEFENSEDPEVKKQKTALIRGLHLITAMPLSSNGQILGVEGTECATITEDYLGAEITDYVGPAVVFEGFINETAASNVIEYTKKFRVNTDKDSVASEGNGKITYSSAYRPAYPVDESGTLLHEARHNDDPLFSDTSAHTDCDGRSCDAGIFGSYGTEMRYHDSLIRGAGQAITADGRYLLDNNEIEYSLYYMCRVIKKKIKYPPVRLVEIYESYGDCADFFKNDVRDAFLLEHYGFDRVDGDVSYWDQGGW